MHIRRIHFHTLDSTNTWAKQHLNSLDKNALTLVTASEQTHGRGRYGRVWFSKSGQNIHVSFVFFSKMSPQKLLNLPQILTISAIQTLDCVKLEIKWPNDLMINGKKMGGILCETASIEGFLGVILGIGLNINLSETELNKIDKPATSLFFETGEKYDLEKIVEALTEIFNKNLKVFLEKGFVPFYAAFTKHLCHKQNDKIKFSGQNRVWEGTFQKINEDGSLVMKLEDGTLQTFFSGEFLEPDKRRGGEKRR